jgi:DNA-binding MarR family transcriptional regulator
MDQADDLAEDLRQAVGKLVRRTRSATSGLAPAHAQTLGYLDREGPMTIAELARRRGVRHQGQSRTVFELEDRGYVVRAASPDDARASVITITSFGESVLLIDRRARSSWLSNAIRADLSSEERDVLAQVPALLERLTRSGEEP